MTGRIAKRFRFKGTMPGKDEMTERLPVKTGLSTLDKPMTRAGALRFGERNMPRDLKRAGFETVVAKSDADLHGGVWFRINYGKKV